jgi:hypothetical protein
VVVQYCYHFQRYRDGEGISLGLAALFLCFFLEFAFRLVTAQVIGQVVASLVLMAIGLGVAVGMVMCYLEICRRYSVTESGLVLEYPFRYTVIHPWETLSEIGICNVHYTARGPVEHLTAIRCVVGEEKKGPRHGYDCWAESWYSALHFRKVITILFTEERLEEFEKVCPVKIQDYRNVRKW